MNRIHQFILPLLAVCLASCGSSRNLNIERGTGYNFQAGLPEFRTAAFGFVNEENNTILEITAEAVKGSLIYKEENDTLQAHISVEYQVQDQENSDNILVSEQLERTIKSTDQGVTSTREALELTFSHPVDPSRYRVLVSITDLNTKKHITQSVETAIPETDGGGHNLTHLQTIGRRYWSNSWSGNTYDVKENVDSLRFVCQAISPRTEEWRQIRSLFVNF